MKKIFSILVIACLITIISTGLALAQSANQLQLGLSRDFGYGGFGNDIQGLFSMKIKNPPQNLVSVEFFIDTSLVGTDAESPFAVQFNTDSYPLGARTLRAVGTLSDGSTIDSNTIQSQFVAAGAGTQSILKFVLPILGLVVIMVIVSFVLPLILSKGKLSAMPLGTPRKYGIGGGAICPKCNRPFPLRLWFINLGRNKIDRCPYCGKWSFVRPRSGAELRQAEAAELSQAQTGPTIGGETEAEKMKKELDNSRFQNP